jgi:hypothetical protein
MRTLFMQTWKSRAVATVAVAAIALTAFSLQPAAAHPRHGNDAAAFAAFAAVFGTIAAIVAAEQYRDRHSYEPSYGYGADYRGPYPGGPHHRHW